MSVPTADTILAFRLARSGLVETRVADLAAAAVAPASDFSRGAALLALAARCDPFSHDRYTEAVDGGELVLAHAPRGAIHALAPDDVALYGRALISSDEEELLAQLGAGFTDYAREHDVRATDALAACAEAVADALADGGALDKVGLHDALRERLAAELLPWCAGCKSHHAPPMLWRYATIVAGSRLDGARRYRLADAGPTPPPIEALRRFLHLYGPATAADFAAWTGVPPRPARQLWAELGDELAEVRVNGKAAWLLEHDRAALDDPPAAAGIRLLPPGDPYLQGPNRPLLAPDPALRKQLFRPIASPGVALANGRVAGLWRIKVTRGKATMTVTRLGRFARKALDREAARVAALRGADDVSIVVD